jgi:hypothetical protein
MWGSAVYGLFLGLGALLFLQAAPQPIGSILWWGFLTGQLTWCAALCWRRTGLPFATGAMAAAAGSSGVLAVFGAAGHVFPDLSRASWVLVDAGLLCALLLLVVESRVHRAKWTQWKQFMERTSAWDIVTGRHIPEMRNSGA